MTICIHRLTKKGKDKMKLYKRLVACTLILTLSIIGAPTGALVTVENVKEVKAAGDSNIRYKHFLKTDGSVVKNNYGSGEQVVLKGVNAGGYMLQEMWMCPTQITTNVKDQTTILSTLTSRFGAEKARNLIKTYEKNYWTDADFDNCVNLGINCIRLPIWYRNLVDENDNWYPDAFERIDWFVEEAGKHGIYVIIDMHGAYGSQNGSDHSGVDGGSDKLGASKFFFGDEAASNQEKYYKMWEKIAKHYKGNPVVAGYDLLNEPFNEYRYTTSYTDEELRLMLWNVYDNAYKRIRAVDADHMIIMMGTWWPDDLPVPSVYGWTNVMYQYHNYKYGADSDVDAQISEMTGKIENIQAHSSYNVPSIMGEFNYFANSDAWTQGLQLLNDSGLSWTVWSYKATSDYGNWGLYNQSVDKPNLETDSYEDILAKWSNVGTCYENTNINSIFKQYTPGVVSGLTDSVENSVPSVTEASAAGGTETIDVSLTPSVDMPGNAKYYVYLDGSSEPAKIISPVIEAENWSEQSGVVKDSNSTDSEGVPLQNVGGTHSGDWTKYNDIDFGTGSGTEITARYAVDANGVGNNPKLEIYVDSMDSNNLAGTLYLEEITGENWNSYKLGSAVLDKDITGKHDIYVKYVVDSGNVCNLDWIQFSAQPINSFNINLPNVSAGLHSVTIKTCVNGEFSEGKQLNDIKVYAQPQKVESIDLYDIGAGTLRANWQYTEDTTYEIKLLYSDGTVKETVTSGYNVSNGIVSYDFTGLDTAEYKVQVTASVNGKSAEPGESALMSIENLLVSTALDIEGFQIRTNERDDSGVAFRTVCKSPNVGSVITVSGKNYTIQDMGTIYTLDTNTSGYESDSQLDISYTLLNPAKVSDDITADKGYSYIGEKQYNNQNRTYGYVATQKGEFAGFSTTDTTNTYYVRTITGLGNLMTNTIHVRAFVVAENSDGKQVIIYAKEMASMSIAEVADYIYKNSKSSNWQGHSYLYNKILSQISSTNPFYRNTEMPYGWNDNLYTPE